MRNQIQVETIREILLKDWDPFCIGDNPNLTGEYDSFIVGIVSLLENHSSFDEFEQYFIRIENELEAPIPDGERAKAIKALQGLYV